MTYTGEEDKGSAIKAFMSLLVGNLWWKKVTAEQMKLPCCFLEPGQKPPSWDSTTGQDQSRQSSGHLLAPNWSLLQLMVSCGCVFTSHLLWVLGFPARLQDENTRRFFIQKLPCSTLQHDQAYLKSLPKTRHYLILALQRELGHRGCLRDAKDQDVFTYWVDQQNTAELEKQQQEILLCRKAAPELKLEDLLKKKSKDLSKIHVSSEGSHSQPEPSHAVLEGGGKQGIGSTPALHCKQNQDGREQKFPRVFTQELQIPKFSTLQPNFLEILGSNILTLRAKEPLHKITAATVTQHKLRLMHSLSLTHMAHSRSLLARNGLTMQYDMGYSLKDLTWNEHLDKVSAKEQPPPPQTLRHHTAPDYSEHTEEQNRSADQMTSVQLSQIKTTRANHFSTQDVPLTMEDLYSHSTSLVKDFGDKMWMNYA